MHAAALRGGFARHLVRPSSFRSLLARSMSATPARLAALPSASFPILQTVPEVRSWRKDAFDTKQAVGFVPTMGALHEGHLELIRQSLQHADQTICSIFVNPAQFAPTEDLSTYPRTLEADLQKLEKLEVDGKKVSALFLPGVADLYPDGIEQDVSKQRGTFVEVVGYSQEMEGQSRPTFFRGVATVVTKLFNITQPDLTFFGQKDVQQCLILRRMISDLHLPHPPSPSHLRIIPTVRDFDNVALSSRNSYLSPDERRHAPALIRALTEAQQHIIETLNAGAEAVSEQDVSAAASRGMEAFLEELYSQPDAPQKVPLLVDYIKMNDPLTLRPMSVIRQGQAAVLSGAIKIGKPRLIDNVLVNIQL